MPHQYIRTFAPVAANLLMTLTSGYRQVATYPNKIARISTGFALGSGGNAAAIILDSKHGEEIGQSTALESLPAKSEYELQGNLINTINFTAQ